MQELDYNYENYSRFNTRGLINYMETGISNFYFKECKAPISHGVARFYIKSRADIQFIPKWKYDILYAENGLYS
jgi:hypothetical protein